MARFPARSRRDFCHREFALGEIRGSIPARLRPPGLLLPGENLGEILSRIAPRFWPLGFLLLGVNLGEIPGRIPARFWLPGILFPGENLAGIPVRFPPGRKIPAAKICRDPSGIPVLILQGKILIFDIWVS